MGRPARPPAGGSAAAAAGSGAEGSRPTPGRAGAAPQVGSEAGAGRAAGGSCPARRGGERCRPARCERGRRAGRRRRGHARPAPGRALPSPRGRRSLGQRSPGAASVGLSPPASPAAEGAPRPAGGGSPVPLLSAPGQRRRSALGGQWQAPPATRLRAGTGTGSRQEIPRCWYGLVSSKLASDLSPCRRWRRAQEYQGCRQGSLSEPGPKACIPGRGTGLSRCVWELPFGAQESSGRLCCLGSWAVRRAQTKAPFMPQHVACSAPPRSLPVTLASLFLPSLGREGSACCTESALGAWELLARHREPLSHHSLLFTVAVGERS